MSAIGSGSAGARSSILPGACSHERFLPQHHGGAGGGIAMIPVLGNSTGDALAAEPLRLPVVRDGHGSSERRWETGAMARQDEIPIRHA